MKTKKTKIPFGISLWEDEIGIVSILFKKHGKAVFEIFIGGNEFFIWGLTESKERGVDPGFKLLKHYDSKKFIIDDLISLFNEEYPKTKIISGWKAKKE